MSLVVLDLEILTNFIVFFHIHRIILRKQESSQRHVIRSLRGHFASIYHQSIFQIVISKPSCDSILVNYRKFLPCGIEQYLMSHFIRNRRVLYRSVQNDKKQNAQQRKRSGKGFVIRVFLDQIS